MFGESMMQGTDFMWGWGGMLFGPLVMVGILVLAIVGMVTIFKGLNNVDK
ncbi:MAG: hypothetical protein L3J13_02125 [Devosiaceae bacterium]|nr:hypothetical protein [Devosiaceae bacterium]